MDSVGAVIGGVIGIFMSFITSMFIQAYHLKRERKQHTHTPTKKKIICRDMMDDDYDDTAINNMLFEKDITGASKDDRVIINVASKDNI